MFYIRDIDNGMAKYFETILAKNKFFNAGIIFHTNNTVHPNQSKSKKDFQVSAQHACYMVP